MMLHIKPTATKDAVFRFKSNFIRFYREFDKSVVPIEKGLTDGIETNGDGIIESILNLSEGVRLIRERYSKACAEEVKQLLRTAAVELEVPL